MVHHWWVPTCTSYNASVGLHVLHTSEEILVKRQNTHFYRATACNATHGIAVIIVRLSHAWIVTKLSRTFWYSRKGNHSAFLTLTVVGTPVFVWHFRSKWPTPFETRRLRQISAYNVSTVRDSEKSSLWRIGNQPRAFQRTIARVRTLLLSPPKGGSKSDLFVFLNKSQV